MLKTLQVYQVSLKLVREIHALIPQLEKHDRNLADQVRRASRAVPLNVAEATARKGKDQAHRYRIAKGENSEVVAALQVAAPCEMLSEEQVKEPLELADRIGAMLYRLTT